jgi:hypothetical protein
MTSPALRYLSLDTHSMSGAFTAPTAAESVILAVLGITSRFIYADQCEPTRRERVTPRCSVSARTCSGFPPTGRALGALRAPRKPPRRHDRLECQMLRRFSRRQARHHLVENPDERRAV